MIRSAVAGLAAAVALLAGTPDPHPRAPLSDPLYTEAQARRGEAAYRDVCAECHTLAEFKDPLFVFAWEGASLAQLYAYVTENMPEDGPGSLPASLYRDVFAYILEMNGYPAGEQEFTADLERLAAVPFESRKPPSAGVDAP
ncbi:MAG: cytochrome c [Longimicrobiales bacterium]|nr:cytochrome c [Longimicrobiales bacterium]